MTVLQRLARRLGYDLWPRRKAKALPAQLCALIEHQGIDCVLDVGANTGQYAGMLRDCGYRGRIVSFEPLPAAHGILCRRAAADPGWRVAAPMAIGERDGETVIDVSAEADMSSLLPQTGLLQRLSPTSRVVERLAVPIRRLDTVAPEHVDLDGRCLLKSDTQGNEAQVLEGAGRLLARIAAIQLELSLVPCYEGEPAFDAMLGRLRDLGFEPFLFLPGYFERKLARQLQVDVVFARPPG